MPIKFRTFTARNKQETLVSIKLADLSPTADDTRKQVIEYLTCRIDSTAAAYAPRRRREILSGPFEPHCRPVKSVPRRRLVAGMQRARTIAITVVIRGDGETLELFPINLLDFRSYLRLGHTSGTAALTRESSE